MDDQWSKALGLIYDILQSLFVFALVYGSKAFTWISNAATTTKHDDNWLSKVVLTCLIILASLKALQMAYRGIMFWVRLTFNFVLIGGAIAIMVWLWGRGLDGAGEDLGNMTRLWTQQYHRYESQARSGKAAYEFLQNARDAVVNERQRAERVHGGRFW